LTRSLSTSTSTLSTIESTSTTPTLTTSVLDETELWLVEGPLVGLPMTETNACIPTNEPQINGDSKSTGDEGASGSGKIGTCFDEVLSRTSSIATSPISPISPISPKSPKVYLVTFDNLKKYALIARALNNTYSKVGIEKHLRWQQQILEKTLFYKENITLFAHKKGFGGWVWKPYIIYDALKRIPDGDYVYYQDCYNDPRGFISSVEPVIDYMEKHKIEILPGLKEPYFNKSFIKDALLKHFNFGVVQELEFLSRKHVCASPIFIKKSDNSVNIIMEWLTLCQKPNLILPKPNPSGVQHNYDMSIWNCILEKYKIRPLNIDLDKLDTKNFNTYIGLFSMYKNLTLDP